MTGDGSAREVRGVDVGGVEVSNVEAPRADVPALAVGLLVPVLAAAAILVAHGEWSDELPDRLATHWGFSGEPDGYGSRTVFVVGSVALTVLFSVPPTVIGGLGRVWVRIRRSMLGLGVWCAVLFGGLGVHTLDIQRAGRDGRLDLPVVLAIVVGASLLALLAARLPRDLRPTTHATTRPPPGLPRSADLDVPEHAIGSGGRLRVEAGTVVVRSFTGRETVRLDVDEVVSARPTTLSGFWEFGGWGLRMGFDGRYAFVGKGSAAVEITLADGAVWTITTPRADDVAGAVNAAADRRPV